MKRCPSCRRVYDRDSAVCQVDGTILDDFNLDPRIGETVAKRYRVVRRLGAGSLGTVYLAQELSTGNNVALKIFAKELQCDDETLKQCRWDARFATASQPSSIVRVYEVDRTDEGQVFVAMEYLEGENLADVMRREGAMELGRALRLASEIAQGLVAASKAGVPHRDLKPQNVLVVGPDERVKMTDFGVARLRRTTMGGTRTRLDSVTLEYTAPEQLNGGDADDRTDIYGLGAVLYAMLTGAAPQTGTSRGRDVSNGIWRAPQPIRELRPEVPVALEHALLRALEHEPWRRQIGIHEFAEDLLDLAVTVIERTTREAALSAVRERALEPSAQAPRAAALVVAEPVTERWFREPWHAYLERWSASRERWQSRRQAYGDSWQARRGQWQAQWQAYRAHFQSYRERRHAQQQAYRAERELQRQVSREQRQARRARWQAQWQAYRAHFQSYRERRHARQQAYRAERELQRQVSRERRHARRQQWQAQWQTYRAHFQSYRERQHARRQAYRAERESQRQIAREQWQARRERWQAQWQAYRVHFQSYRERRHASRQAYRAEREGQRQLSRAQRQARWERWPAQWQASRMHFQSYRERQHARWRAYRAEREAQRQVSREQWQARWERWRAQRQSYRAHFQSYRLRQHARWRAYRAELESRWQLSREHPQARRERWRAQWQAYRAHFQSYRERQRARWQVYRAEREAQRQARWERWPVQWQAYRVHVQSYWERRRVWWQACRAQLQSYRERWQAQRQTCREQLQTQWRGYRTRRQLRQESPRIDSHVARSWSRLERARSSLGKSAERLTAHATHSLGDGLRRGNVRRGRFALAGVVALVVVGAMAWATLDWRAEAPSPVRSIVGRDSGTVGEPGAIERASQTLAAAPPRRAGGRISSAVDLAPSPAAPAAGLVPAARQPSPRPSVRPAAEVAVRQGRPDALPGRPAEPASRPAPLSMQQISRIQTEAERKLSRRGLLRVSAADRWGVTLETSPTGEVTLAGVLRDMALYADTVRLVREVPGVRDVRGNVEVADVGPASIVQSESARIQAEIQQRLRSRGLLRESAADRWGVTVEVSPERDVTLVGAVRDAAMYREAVRRAQEVANVRLVKQDIRVMDQGDGQ